MLDAQAQILGAQVQMLDELMLDEQMLDVQAQVLDVQAQILDAHMLDEQMLDGTCL